jgi:hypothetical protein
MSLDSNNPKTVAIEPQPLSAPVLQKSNWLLFWVVLLAPMMGAMMLAVAGQAGKDIGAYVVFCGSGISAIVCGYLMAGRIASSLASRVLLTILLPVGFYFLCVILCFAGCAIATNLK